MVSFWEEIYNFTDININDTSYEAFSFWVEIYNVTDVNINDTSYKWPNTFAAIMVPNGGY